MAQFKEAIHETESVLEAFSLLVYGIIWDKSETVRSRLKVKTHKWLICVWFSIQLPSRAKWKVQSISKWILMAKKALLRNRARRYHIFLSSHNHLVDCVISNPFLMTFFCSSLFFPSLSWGWWESDEEAKTFLIKCSMRFFCRFFDFLLASKIWRESSVKNFLIQKRWNDKLCWATRHLLQLFIVFCLHLILFMCSHRNYEKSSQEMPTKGAKSKPESHALQRYHRDTLKRALIL